MRCFFFFKQKTAYEMRISDWSSDVCSSDLAGTDNSALLGSGAIRWSAVYSATGAINTSDEREKTWQGAASAAALAAAARIARELSFYCWNDAIAAKGAAGARRHFRLRAEAVWAFTARAGMIAPLGEGPRADHTPAVL